MKILLFTPLEKNGHLDLWHNEIKSALIKNNHQIVEVTCTNHLDLNDFANINLGRDLIVNTLNSNSNSKVKKLLIFLMKKILGQKLYKFLRSTILLKKTARMPNDILDEFSSPELLYRQLLINIIVEKDIDLIFFTYLDFFSNKINKHFPQIVKLLDKPWVGLVFDSRSEIVESLSKSENCHGIGVVDSFNRDRIEILSRCRVVLFNDFPSLEVNKLKSPNDKEKIDVTIYGSLSKRKNLDLFLAGAFSKQGKKYNWNIFGELHPIGLAFSTKFRLYLLRYLKFSNIRFEFSFVSNSKLAEILARTDIIFLAYKDWPFMSSILTQAVNCGIPVLGSPGGILELNIREFNLGTILTRNSRKELFLELAKLSKLNINRGEAARYLRIHSKVNFEYSCLKLIDMRIE